ncbi:MAG: bb3-type cytochrome oxidase subunit III [Noviherbaspirillum sp.]
MRTQPYFRASDGGDDYAGATPAAGGVRPSPAAVLSTALWAFIGVATSLFFLFIASYLMRMQSADWHAIAMPWQLWLSSGLLLAASAAMHGASTSGRHGNAPAMRMLLLAAGLFMLIFLFAQSWAWQALLASRISATGNPAASYFYLLTAMHGLHVAGGMVAWLIVARPFLHRGPRSVPARAASSVRMCERYWHFLLLTWLALFATMAGLTNDVVRFICGAA